MKSEKYYQLIKQYKEIHKSTFYGQASTNLQDYIKPHVTFQVNSILDYGCGNSNLCFHLAEQLGSQRAWRYDPCVKRYAMQPLQAVDLLLCTEVLEHIPEPDIPLVLQDLKEICLNCFLSISTRIAGKILPNGDNAHCTVKPKEWWLSQIEKIFGTAILTKEIEGEGIHVKTWK